MAVFDQCVTDRFAVYHGDCMDVMRAMANGSVHLSVYSPPFGGLYHYSSSDRDLSNSPDYAVFCEHYEFVVAELATREGVREGKVLSPATVKQRLALLKAACRWAWKKHSICENDPTTRMLMPKVRNERQVYLTRRQMLTLARASDRHDVRVMIRAAFYTGMRIGELERVSVSRGALHLDDSKNDERRSVPLHPRLRTCAKYLPLSTPRSTLDRGWQRAREACNMAHVHLHDIRHSAASEMINADVDLYTVGTVLGHKDPRSTKRYSHLRPDKLAEAVCRIGQKSPHKQTKKATKKATRKAA